MEGRGLGSGAVASAPRAHGLTMARPGWFAGWATCARLGAFRGPLAAGIQLATTYTCLGPLRVGLHQVWSAAEAATGGVALRLASGWLTLGFPNHTLVRATIANKSMRACCRKN